MNKLVFILNNVFDSFSGNYKSQGKEYKDMRDDIMDISTVPGPHADKVNLRNDANNVLRDYRTAKNNHNSKALAHG